MEDQFGLLGAYVGAYVADELGLLGKELVKALADPRAVVDKAVVKPKSDGYAKTRACTAEEGVIGWHVEHLLHMRDGSISSVTAVVALDACLADTYI